MTTSHWRSSSTVIPPSTPCATTPPISAHARTTRSRRNGRRRSAATPAAIEKNATTEDSRRLPYSIATCESSSGVKPPWQRGQSGQPRPDPDSRTPAPENTIRTSAASAAQARRRLAAGVKRRLRVMPRLFWRSRRGPPRQRNGRQLRWLHTGLLEARRAVRELLGAVALRAARVDDADQRDDAADDDQRAAHAQGEAVGRHRRVLHRGHHRRRPAAPAREHLVL